MDNFIVDQNFLTPITVNSKTFSTNDLGDVISDAYSGLSYIASIYLAVHGNDIHVKSVLKDLATDSQLEELIERQLRVHTVFKYSFSINFEYFSINQFTPSEYDSKIF